MAAPEMGRIVSIGPLQGGGVTNAVPDLARAWGNARTSTPEQADELAAMLEALNSPEEVVAPGAAQVIVRHKLARPPKPLTPEVERLALAARAAAEDLGQRLPFAKTGGVCDGNNMQAGGLPTIDTLGVRGGGLHTRQEWIDLESLVERCQLLAVLLARIAEGRMDAGAGRAGGKDS
jgi:glutamate carboxypeptidase